MSKFGTSQISTEKADVERRLMILTTLFVTGIVVSNVIAAKIVKIGVFVFPASILSYTFTFILSNMVSDILDKKYSSYLIWMGFLAQAVASGLVLLGLFMPAESIDRGEAYRLLLGMNWRFTLASFCAYGASQFLNYYIFNSKLLKSKFVANLVSVLIAQLFDTIVFTFVAFTGVYPRLWSMILSQYIIKVIIVVVTNPIFLLTKKLR
ncbi:MAG TPA: queuosine precursor transporter [Fervidobacterium sp.]|nr:queuosine precursor transporter [Fervidobacterium sp.]HOL04143.1 queuosine precursor transporter [Fervidobacterium sp.]HON04273.1 queuosine precursor transporter [Fervidobacterium sp.]HOS52069.1 queuosine precursor transporter [Fervidobacterium sp.]HPC79546.1 queuosine precursor transporter [Fervidobacterium sp.]